MITSHRWEKLQAIFTAAMQRPPGERLSFAREASVGDAELQAELESLLCSSDESSFLKGGIKGAEDACRILLNLDPLLDEAESQREGSGQTIENAAHVRPHLPTTIGRYRISRLVGEGGMGLVYEAEQAQPRRVVALKVIKTGWTNPEVVRRFRRESQALARLQHPGIAQVYEAGEESSGEGGSQLFFAMEFIHGEQLLKYAKTHHLTTPERLELMAKVCDAVDHAHERGLIHRDLKPGNILVDEVGQPKILDFGVARVTGGDVEATRQTEVGQLLGTVAYMSPEQVLGDPLALDRRSDVYALGVILYELLAERLPYRVSPNNMNDALRAVQQDDPEPLSSIQRSYRGDVETIVAKALEKDKARRYSSAADLAADLRRYLQNEPITARPPSMIYQLEKFARRHKTIVAGVGAVFLVLMAGVVVSTQQALRARRAERSALSEAAKAKAVNDFLENDLLAQASANKQSSPNTTPDPDLKVRTALDRAAARIEGKFDRQPELEAEIRNTIGNTYTDLGLYPQARDQQQRAVELYRRTLGNEDHRTIEAMNGLVVTFLHLGDFGRAESLANEALGIAHRIFGPDDPVVALCLNNLGKVYYNQGKWSQAEALQDQAFKIRRRVLGPEDPNTLGVMNNLAADYAVQGKYAQAEALYNELLEVERRVLGPEHPRTLESIFNLGSVYISQGQNARAVPLYSQLLEVERRALGPEHPDTVRSMSNLAASYTGQGDYAHAEVLDRQVVDIQQRILGPEHPDTLRSMCNLAANYIEEGKYAQAETLGRQTLDIQQRILGAGHPSTLITMGNLAQTYGLEKKYTQAEALFEKDEEITRRVLSPGDLQSLQLLKAEMYQEQTKYDKAERIAAESLAALRHTVGPEDPNTIDAATTLALAYLSERKFSQAEPLARESLDFDRKRRLDNWQLFCTETLLGSSLAGQKRYGEAEPLLLEGYRGMAARKQRMAVPDRYYLDLAGQWIVQLYQNWGKPQKAAAWRKARAAH